MEFRKQYALSWRDALRDLDHRDLADLVNGLDLNEQWSATDENIARLVDRDDYYLRSKYAQWIHDPDDADAERERQLRKKRGIKPPPEPIVAPVAVRPPRVAAAAWDTYAELALKHAPKPERVTDDGRKKVSISQLREQQARTK